MMQAGTYYVGDLCYVTTNEEWLEICELTIVNNECLEGEFTLKDGRRFAMYGTKYGDGTYQDSERLYEFSVDSGTIGCILDSDIDHEKVREKYKDQDGNYNYNPEKFGAIITFMLDFVTGGGRDDENWEGCIQFGRVLIETSPEWNDDYEEEYED